MSTLRQILRQLARRRTPTVLSVALLALGVGLSVAFYSLLDSALLSGLPFPDGDRLVAFSTRDAAGWPMPLDDYREIASAQHSFEWTLPTRTFNTMLTRGDRTRGLIGSYVPPALFERLGVEPVLGRAFTAEDEAPANPSAVVISYRLWHGTYGADPGILGEEITLNRERCVVVGVMPQGFHFPIRHDVWGVFGRPGREWEQSYVFGFGKLADGVTPGRARQDLARIAQYLDTSQPQQAARTATLESFVRANIGDRARGALRAMVLAALGLLALTCANLANLRLSESLRRTSELDTRLALGARPLGLIRRVLLENLVLGVVAAALGLALAWALCETLGRKLLQGASLERVFWVEAGIDLRAAGFAVACAIAASLLGALAPIIATTLRATSGSFSARASRTHTAAWARGLVSLQVGLCFALLTAAGLWSTKANDLLSAQPGFEVDQLSSVTLSLYQSGLDEPAERHALLQQLQRELQDADGVVAAAYASAPPWGRTPRAAMARGGVEPDREIAPAAEVFRVSPSFFETLGLELLAGSAFRSAEIEAGDGAVISRALADRLFPQGALGQTLTLAARRPGNPPQQARILGIANNLDLDRTDHPDRNLAVYLPVRAPAHGTFLLIRRQPGLASARPLVEDTLARVAPLVGTLDELSVVDALESSIWVERRLGQIFSLFALAALLVTAGGIYAVIAVMVRSRERELGIRAAIGARPGDLQRLVLGESGRQLVLGLLVGVSVLWLGYRVMDSALTDGLELRPDVLAAAATIVAAGCLVGSWSPTRRAARTDPTQCLSAD
ncbi:MAG: ABC transporter permease [Acidobacteriota bacterium]